MPSLVVVDAAAWMAVQVAAGYVVHRLPEGRLGDGWLFRERPFEQGGRLYVRLLRVNRWKHRLPEGGTVFAGGFDKRRLGGRDDQSLQRYVRETRRAELGHWLAMLPAPLFFAWNPPAGRVATLAYALAVNAPCIVSMRYNRLRLTRLLERRQRTAS